MAKRALFPVGQAAEHHIEDVVLMRMGWATWRLVSPVEYHRLGEQTRTDIGPAVVAGLVGVRKHARCKVALALWTTVHCCPMFISNKVEKGGLVK